MSSSVSHCPLCLNASQRPFHRDQRREYVICANCWLVWVPERFHLNECAEKAEYDRHENDLNSLGYRRFLARLADPILARRCHGDGLDFGCGPGPLLAKMLAEGGLSMDVYDPFYANNPAIWSKRFQVITATEVVEHLRTPGITLEAVWQLLEPGGLLGLMTKRWLSQDKFRSWHYINDPTHVIFFHLHTFYWLAQHWRAKLTVAGPDTVIFEKP